MTKKAGDPAAPNTKAEAAPLTNRARQRIDTRNQVYEAAIAEFKKVGVANAQIDAIISRAGVSVGTFYRYFTGKDDVLRELQRRNAGAMIELVGTLKKSTDLRKYLQQLLKLLLIDEPPEEVTLEREALMMVVKSPHEIDYENHPIFSSVIAKIQSGQDEGAIRTDISAKVMGKLFFHQVFGISAGTLREKRDRSEIDALLEMYLSGIEARLKPSRAKKK
jgi:AcrR family transcriptional regulator